MNKYIVKATLLVAVATFVGISANTVVANTMDSSTSLRGLKVAIVKDAIGTQDIVSGDYRSGLNKIASTTARVASPYDQAMGACVANIKLKKLAQANSDCSQAINAIDEVSGRSRQKEFLKSMAYSNRAIVRYLAQDNIGALDDLTSALLVDDNEIVKSNIMAFKHINAKTSDSLYSATIYTE
ncbi:hypothetical protein [Colwellia sp. MEBiC06753]